VKMYLDNSPDAFFAGNASNARIQRTGSEGSQAAKDVERRDNTACLKLRSAEGSPFVVQQPPVCETQLTIGALRLGSRERDSPARRQSI
jgi:hypothetical protein